MYIYIFSRNLTTNLNPTLTSMHNRQLTASQYALILITGLAVQDLNQHSENQIKERKGKVS